MERRIINPWTWQDALGYVQGHEVRGDGRILFCAGIASTDADGNLIHADDMKAQLARTMDNLETVLAEAGYTLAHVVRLTYYTTDMERYWEADESLDLTGRLAAARCRPASTLLGVAALAWPGLLVELEATAVA